MPAFLILGFWLLASKTHKKSRRDAKTQSFRKEDIGFMLGNKLAG